MALMFSDGPPQYGTAPWAELPFPHGFAVLVFVPAPNGTAHVVAFGPPDPDEEHGVERVLAAAHEKADQVHGVVVGVPVLSDHR